MSGPPGSSQRSVCCSQTRSNSFSADQSLIAFSHSFADELSADQSRPADSGNRTSQSDLSAGPCNVARSTTSHTSGLSSRGGATEIVTVTIRAKGAALISSITDWSQTAKDCCFVPSLMAPTDTRADDGRLPGAASPVQLQQVAPLRSVRHDGVSVGWNHRTSDTSRRGSRWRVGR